MTLSINRLLRYFSGLNVAFHDIHSILGFFILLVIMSQIVSGTMVSFSLIPEPMLIPVVRDEEDLEDLYTDDFFWLHERGVDLLFIFSWFHLLRKLYLNLIEYEHENTWKSGVFTFLILHVVTFLGLVLCCTHLSEITLVIAVNIINTFVMNVGKFYWWLFTDKQLNTDTLVRLAYAHYISAFFILYLGVVHALDMHYDWKNESAYDGLDFELNWWDEALMSELTWSAILICLFTLVCLNWYPEPEALSYELFMWGDIGLVNDIRFYGVAPHWYFRPYMAWLIAIPYHNTGIFGMVYLFWALFNQPVIHGITDYLLYLKKVLVFLKFKLKRNIYFRNSNLLNEINLYHQLTYFFFLMACLYTSSFLPYGRFYNRIGGNFGMLGAYVYVFMYLTFNFFRRPILIDLIVYNIFHKVRYLNGSTNLNLPSTINN